MSRRTRCAWIEGGNAAYVEYHDQEWGVPAREDRRQFEFLVLEGAQAGLSWAIVLNRREAYRKAFADFDAAKVARYSPARIAWLLENPAIIRNRQKLAAAVSNARAFLAVQEEFGSFSRYIWGFVDDEPVQNHYRDDASVPATTRVSDALSLNLRRRGFKFVGSTIVYAHMQATGMVNDHLLSCFRHRECARLAKPSDLATQLHG